MRQETIDRALKYIPKKYRRIYEDSYIAQSMIYPDNLLGTRNSSSSDYLGRHCWEELLDILKKDKQYKKHLKLDMNNELSFWLYSLIGMLLRERHYLYDGTLYLGGRTLHNIKNSWDDEPFAWSKSKYKKLFEDIVEMKIDLNDDSLIFP